MHQLTPTGPNVIDAMTGKFMPAEGVRREVLLPPDHYAKRTGDLTITEVTVQPAQVAQADRAAAADSQVETTAKQNPKR